MLPVPKFAIGQTVWRATMRHSAASWPCPDCAGTGLWKVTTAANDTLTLSCGRCGGSSCSSEGIPSLRYEKREPSVQSLTIGSVRIDTADYDGETVKYMCRETGIGSGSVYRESELHDTEAAAQAIADTMAIEASAVILAKPEALRAKHFSHLTLKDALTSACWHARWDAWYAYRRLAEELEDIAKTNEDVRNILDFERGYRDSPSLSKVEAALAAGNIDDLRALLLPHLVKAEAAAA